MSPIWLFSMLGIFGSLILFIYIKDLRRTNVKSYMLESNSLSVESDARIRTCMVLFGYEKPESFVKKFRQFHKGAMMSNRWCLVFRFDDFKIMICDAPLYLSRHIAYRNLNAIDLITFGKKLILLGEVSHLSPQLIQQMSLRKNSIRSFNITNNQQCIRELAKLLRIDRYLRKILVTKENKLHFFEPKEN